MCSIQIAKKKQLTSVRYIEGKQCETAGPHGGEYGDDILYNVM
jgi:hypothetical protein